jgi:hypothetical protein
LKRKHPQKRKRKHHKKETPTKRGLILIVIAPSNSTRLKNPWAQVSSPYKKKRYLLLFPKRIFCGRSFICLLFPPFFPWDECSKYVVVLRRKRARTWRLLFLEPIQVTKRSIASMEGGSFGPPKFLLPSNPNRYLEKWIFWVYFRRKYPFWYFHCKYRKNWKFCPLLL